MPGAGGTGTQLPAPWQWGCWGNRNLSPAPPQPWGRGAGVWREGNEPLESCPKCLAPQGQCPGSGWVLPAHGSLSTVPCTGWWGDWRCHCHTVQQQWKGRGGALGANPCRDGSFRVGCLYNPPGAPPCTGTVAVGAEQHPGVGASSTFTLPDWGPESLQPINFFLSVARAGYGRAGGDRGGCRARQRWARQACW